MVQRCAKGRAPGEAITEFDTHAAQIQRQHKAFMAPIDDRRHEVDAAERMSAAPIELPPRNAPRDLVHRVTIAQGLAELRRRLRVEFADMTAQAVDCAIEDACVRTANARVETFRLVFVERHARAALRRLRRE